MNITVEQAEQLTGVTVEEQWDRSLEVPVVTGIVRQGDVLVAPHRAGKDKGNPIPTSGVAVVRGEARRNTHTLVPSGACWWRPVTDSLILGELTVPDGSVAYLSHPEHAFTGIGAGSYTVRRQRE